MIASELAQKIAARDELGSLGKLHRQKDHQPTPIDVG